MFRPRKQKSKYSLDQIGDMLLNVTNDFANFKNETRNNFKQVKEDVNEVKQEVKNINDRLDYVVRANSLKDLPKNKNN